MQACLHTSFPSQVKQFNAQDPSFASGAVLTFVFLGNRGTKTAQKSGIGRSCFTENKASFACARLYTGYHPVVKCQQGHDLRLSEGYG